MKELTRSPLSPEDQRQLALPESALVYLGLNRLARDPRMSRSGIQNVKDIQLKLLGQMTAKDRKELCNYIEWQANQIKRGSQRLRGNTFHEGTIIQ